MKTIILLFIILIIKVMLQAQVSKTVDITAGGLMTALTADELDAVTNLTITGTIDARDFRTLRDIMPLLAVLDLSRVTVVQYSGTYGTLGDPSYAASYAAKAIPYSAFHYKTRLITVLLPSSIEEIGNAAFQGCSGLTSINIPSTVTLIGVRAFNSCTGLTSVSIPASVTKIEGEAFHAFGGTILVDAENQNYSSLDGVLFDKDKRYLFQCPTSKTGNYYIPSSVNYIESGAFWGCNRLDSLTIPLSVVSINGVFNNCSAFISVDKANTRYGSQDGVLYDYFYNRLIKCSTSKTGDYIIPSGVTEIDYGAFDGCNKLTSLTIPSSYTRTVDVTGGFALINFGGLINVDPDNPALCSIDGVLFDKLQTRLLKCPVSRSGTYAIPSSVVKIGKYSFSNCTYITSVIIPASVKSIGEEAFSGCSGLTSIFSNSLFPPDLNIFSSVFDGVDKTSCILYVPDYTNYATAIQWEKFISIVEISFVNIYTTEINVASLYGSTATTDIVSGVSWKASSDQIWLTLDAISGIGEQTLTFTAEANPNITARTAIVTVSAEGVDSQTITVTQEGKPTALPNLAENSTQFKCYPNPFTDEITIVIQNPKRTELSVDIYNLTGERIKNLATQRKDEKMELKWNGTNDLGQKVVPGVYICKVNNQAKRMIYQGQKGKN